MRGRCLRLLLRVVSPPLLHPLLLLPLLLRRRRLRELQLRARRLRIRPPPAQLQAPSLGRLSSGGLRSGRRVLRARLERLACDFDLSDNYFAWQAFGRRYASGGSGPLPPYLQRENFETLRKRISSVDVQHRSFTEFLHSEPPGTVNAFVLLDAQDWMTDQQLTELWTEIARAAAPGARVIFRTAGEETILPGRIPDEILARFDYDVETCKQWTAKDRSSIYGGFHLYTMKRSA